MLGRCRKVVIFHEVVGRNLNVEHADAGHKVISKIGPLCHVVLGSFCNTRVFAVVIYLFHIFECLGVRRGYVADVHFNSVF